MGYYIKMSSPVGELLLAEEGGSLVALKFGKQTPSPRGYECHETPTLALARKQLEEYFQGERQVFDVPLAPKGTDFMRQVWDALLDIPYGETRSYKDIAEATDSPKAFRAVGLANNRNPISIIIPCHRVIGSSGKLVGYGGGLDAKEFLLGLERRL